MPLPPPFRRADLDTSNPVDREIKNGLQRERARIVATAQAHEREQALARIHQAEEREARQIARERLGLVQDYERKRDKAGDEFEKRKQASRLWGGSHDRER